MARIRIHELAKKLGKENKEILNYLTEKGIRVKSPMNSLEEEQVAMVELSLIHISEPTRH